MHDVLYLDFDGVLHPDAVYRHREPPFIRLRSPGHHLFESCDVLERALRRYPATRIVLSTSWVAAFSYSATLRHLPEGLRRRVVGATYHRLYTPDFRFLTRYQTIVDDTERRRPRKWLAIDNDDAGWPDSSRHQLVRTPDELGLACPRAQADLTEKLRAVFADREHDNTSPED